MNKIEEIFRETRHLSGQKKDKAIAEYLQRQNEDTILEDIEKFSDKTMEDMRQLQKDVIAYKLRWLNDPIVNKNEVCRLLYGKDDASTRGYFSQQRKGLRPWKSGQMKRLEEIKKEKAIVFQD